MTRAVSDNMRLWTKRLAQNSDLIIVGAPDVQQWISPGKKAVAQLKAAGEKFKYRILSRPVVRVLQRLALSSVVNHLIESVALRFKCCVLCPHEAFTTNACLFCFVFDNEDVWFDRRYRVCPIKGCPTRQKKPFVRVDRELIATLNNLVATAG